MVSEHTVLGYISRALWDPHPTRTDARAQQLAFALGYPYGWRVVRTLEEEEDQEEAAAVIHSNPHNNNSDDDNDAIDTTDNVKQQQPTPATLKSDDELNPQPHQQNQKEGPLDLNEGEENSPLESSESVTSISKATHAKPSKTSMPKMMMIVDRIYAGHPKTGCDMWFHHEAAMKVAALWNTPAGTEGDDATGLSSSTVLPTPFDQSGGHLLPRQPLFAKNDKVQVQYEGKWLDATILRRKEHKTEGFKYQVHYTKDTSKQSSVDERLIRWRTESPDPKLTAQKLGFVHGGWEAYISSHNHYKIISPNGEVFKSKKQAELAYASYSTTAGDGKDDVDDPPWRIDGNNYLGRKVVYTSTHQASARRVVPLEQRGTVVGWISETDVDRAGEPGFVSERTGQPARLYHVKFAEVPHHPYVNLLLESIDLEEYELVQCLVPLDNETSPADAVEPAKKKARMNQG